MRKHGMHIGTSPLSNVIYAGRLAADGDTWVGEPVDVTVPALVAVAEHVAAAGKPVVITANGAPHYEISVRVLPGNTEVSARVADVNDGSRRRPGAALEG